MALFAQSSRVSKRPVLVPAALAFAVMTMSFSAKPFVAVGGFQAPPRTSMTILRVASPDADGASVMPDADVIARIRPTQTLSSDDRMKRTLTGVAMGGASVLVLFASVSTTLSLLGESAKEAARESAFNSASRPVVVPQVRAEASLASVAPAPASAPELLLQAAKPIEPRAAVPASVTLRAMEAVAPKVIAPARSLRAPRIAAAPARAPLTLATKSMEPRATAPVTLAKPTEALITAPVTVAKPIEPLAAAAPVILAATEAVVAPEVVIAPAASVDAVVAPEVIAPAAASADARALRVAAAPASKPVAAVGGYTKEYKEKILKHSGDMRSYYGYGKSTSLYSRN